MRIARVNKIVISSENTGSGSLKRLADTLTQRVGYKVWLVKPERVRGRKAITFHRGVDKLTQFRSFQQNEVSCPKFTTDPQGLSQLAEFKDQKFVARKLLNSSEGKGIEIFDETDPVPRAPLYTQYVPKKKEFRVHVFNNRVIDISEKRKRSGFEGERNTQVRNTNNGYVFCRDSINTPDGLGDLAKGAVAAIQRTQGAVDIIWNEKKNKLYVLEVNSNPGMEGTTLVKYAEAILNG